MRSIFEGALTSEDRKACYAAYLKTEHWRNLRAQKFDRDGAECAKCKSGTRIVVHHLNYRNIFDCTLDDLQVLCDSCHKAVHGIVDDFPIPVYRSQKKRKRKRARGKAGKSRGLKGAMMVTHIPTGLVEMQKWVWRMAAWRRGCGLKDSILCARYPTAVRVMRDYQAKTGWNLVALTSLDQKIANPLRRLLNRAIKNPRQFHP